MVRPIYKVVTMKESPKILLVDDDRDIRELVASRLATYGFEAVAVDSGAKMHEELARGGYDLIILDIMLRGEDGLTLCKELRSSGANTGKIPILFLSALNETTDRIVGLEIGADDYLPKPFETRELVARIKAILRRSESKFSSEDTNGALAELPVLRFGEWRLNTAVRHLVAPNGLVSPLSAAEYRLLTYFLDHPQQVLTRDQLVEYIASRSPDIYDRSLDAQISRLRAKLKDNARNPQIILTMRGDGYMLATPVFREAGEDA